MQWEQPLQYAALSDIGFRRQNNQDACVVQLSNAPENWHESGHLFVVADGMGGHAVGELASKLAVDTVPHTFQKLRQQPHPEALRQAIETANTVIHERGLLNRDFLRMGTTCTAMLLCPQGALFGHVGDSRAYRIRQQRIEQLTSDHSLIWELIQQRKVSPEEAERLYPRNVITRSLGPEPTVQVDVEGPFEVMPGDTYLLCSDGLTSHVSDSEIGMIAGELSPSEACRLLVHLANLRGGVDNTTVISVRLVAPPDALAFESGEAAPPQPDWLDAVIFIGLATVALLGMALWLLTPLWLLGLVVLLTAVLLTVIRLIVSSRRKEVVDVPVAEAPSTQHWMPPRIAPAQITPGFLQQLARIEAELHRAAHEENWPVDWGSHDACVQRADVAMKLKQLPAALREYARALDLLMTGVHWQRKQLHHETRWGKAATPPARTKPD
ncbi:MAG: PP2C family serine/threonine-protein phosphatase [Planctomycetaceae bacterium]